MCVCLRIVVYNTYFCFVFLRVVCPVLPVFLDCPFFIAHSVFSNVHLFLDNTSILILGYTRNVLSCYLTEVETFFFRVTDNYIIFNGIITNSLYFSYSFSYRAQVGGVRHIKFSRR